MAKRTWFSARAGANGTAEIAIYDEIGGWGVNSSAFRDALDGLGDVKTLNVRLNSPGGDVFDGIAIHNMLERHPAAVNVTIDGIAASIASLVAMAGDTRSAPENAMMMVHNPFGMVIGNASDMQGMAEALDKIRDGMVATYARRTGLDPDAVRGMMDAETWLTAKEAVDSGFLDSVSEPRKIAARFDLSRFEHPPAKAPQAAYDPDNDGDDDVLEALGYIGQAVDALADAVGALTGTGDEDDEQKAPAMAASVKAKASLLRRILGALPSLRDALPFRVRAAAESWTVGAARDLPIDEKDAWDGPAAAERMLDAAGFNGDNPSPATARRGFLTYDSGNPKLKGSYKLPFADNVGGELRAMAGGLRAAAQRLPQTDIPDDVRTRAQAVLDAYSERRKGNGSMAATSVEVVDPPAAPIEAARSQEIASLCMIAGYAERTLAYLQSGKTPNEVRSELQALRADRGRDPADDVSARHALADIDVAAAGWGKTIDKINSRRAG